MKNKKKDVVIFSGILGAQGDLMLKGIDQLPEGLRPMTADRHGKLVVSHSESGHHHYFVADGNVEVLDPPNGDGLISYLQVSSDYADLLHEKESADAHKTVRVPRGTYEIHRQRESGPSGWQAVQD
jgi:hypothetical protein